MTEYPSSFPLSESVEVVRIIRENQVMQQLPLFSYNIWVLQGFAMKTTIGDPTRQPIQVNCVDPVAFTPNLNVTPKFIIKPDNFNAVEALEQINASHVNDTDIHVQFAVPWMLILKWALEELIKVLNTHTSQQTP